MTYFSSKYPIGAMLDFFYDAGAGNIVVPMQDRRGQGTVTLMSWDLRTGVFHENVSITCGDDDHLLKDVTMTQFKCMYI